MDIIVSIKKALTQNFTKSQLTKFKIILLCFFLYVEYMVNYTLYCNIKLSNYTIISHRYRYKLQ